MGNTRFLKKSIMGNFRFLKNPLVTEKFPLIQYNVDVGDGGGVIIAPLPSRCLNTVNLAQYDQTRALFKSK